MYLKPPASSRPQLTSPAFLSKSQRQSTLPRLLLFHRVNWNVMRSGMSSYASSSKKMSLETSPRKWEMVCSVRSAR